MSFSHRHIGPDDQEQATMLAALGLGSLEELVAQVVPASLRLDAPLALPPGLSESGAQAALRAITDENHHRVPLLGLGYSGTITPAVIRRNVLENPAWYTAYTPYQPEISQGRLEAILNFQTMVADLTGMDLANASLLDEGTAVAEAMTLCLRAGSGTSRRFVVDADVHPQTLAVLATRAEPIGVELVVSAFTEPSELDGAFGVLVQYPGSSGRVRDLAPIAADAHERGALVVVAADPLSLLLLRSPGDARADVVVGSSQRFGVPMGFGGPHAAFLATRDRFARSLPGRLVGVSTDTEGRPALRLALQTREQHIRREKATSNICTAQVLLAVMAGMYAVYHGPDGLREIAGRVHALTSSLADGVRAAGLSLRHESWFDTLAVEVPSADEAVDALARAGYDVRRIDSTAVGISLDETSTERTVADVVSALGGPTPGGYASPHEARTGVPEGLGRVGEVLSHPVFHRYHSEHEMLRYLRRLSDLDLALDRTMIPLGSCTMKLNAAAEMEPITWPELADVHPFAPADQTEGWVRIIRDLEQMMVEVTGYAAVSLQPNAGSQGELAGLLAIRAYHASRGEAARTVCLIPSSAHGTNAASAVMAGMQVVVVACDENGNVDLADLKSKAEAHSARLAGVMVTYPSTHGVFEEGIVELCEVIHAHGGQVYVDGANLNALVGLAKPGWFGADVSHLNLHKTFCIPHGGGGPGVGPVAVAAHLVPHLPTHPFRADAAPGADGSVGPISAAPFGSAAILPIPWMYVTMMGGEGLQRATEVAILNANYLAWRLSAWFPVLYTGANGRVAHECILDLRPLTKSTGVTVDDIAKRLMDHGFHAPTMSFPVTGTLMIEPTESESLAELDRFCDAMAAIRAEIDQIAQGDIAIEDSPLRHAPHTAADVVSDDWKRAYSREQAAYPSISPRQHKYWPPVSRIDAASGDRNLVCSCPPVEAFA